MSIRDYKGGLLADGLTLVMSEGAAAGTGTTASTCVDLGALVDVFGSALTNDIGEGGGLWFNAYVSTAITTASTKAGVLTLKLKTSSSAATGVSMSSTLATTSTTLTSGALAAGTSVMRVPIPADQAKRYVGFHVYNESTSNKKITAGAINCWIGKDSETPK